MTVDFYTANSHTNCDCSNPALAFTALIKIRRGDLDDNGVLDKNELAKLIKENEELAALGEEEILNIFNDIEASSNENDELLDEDLESLNELLDELIDTSEIDVETLLEETPFFISEENEDAQWTLHKESEKELDDLIISSGLLSQETTELKTQNTENLNRVYEEILEQKKNNPDITDEELSELYAELTQYLEERDAIEETILKELKEVEENSQNADEIELAKYLSETLMIIQEKRENFNYAQNDEIEDIEDIEDIEETQTPDKTNDGGGGGGATPGSVTPQTAEITLENMDIEKLKIEVETREKAYNTSKENLQKATSGSSDAIKKQEKNVEDAQIAYDEAFNSIPEEDTEIAEKKNELKLKNEEITAKENGIKEQKTNLGNMECQISSLNVTIQSLEGIVAQYTAAYNAWQASPMEGLDNSEAGNIKAALDQKTQELADAKKERDSLNAAKEGLETTIKTEEEKLEQLNSEKEIIEEELSKLLEKHPEIQAKLKEASENLKLQKSELERIKSEEIKKAQDDLSAKEKSYTEAKAIYDKRQTTPKYPTKMENIVTHEGDTYLSVYSQEEIEDIMRYAAKNGYANIYEGWGNKCLHAAYEYELYGERGKTSSLKTYTSPSVDETVQKMAETLNNGNPVVAKVDTKAGHRHFVLVIGIKQNAVAPYKQSDFLCIDSYNHEVDKMGQPGQEALDNGNYRTLYSQNGLYWLASHVVDFS